MPTFVKINIVKISRFRKAKLEFSEIKRCSAMKAFLF